MKRQKKQLITLLSFLVFLAIAYFGLKSYNDAETKKEEEASTIYVTNFTSDEVDAFSYDYSGVTYSFTKEDTEWIFEGDASLNMDETIIHSMLAIAGNVLAQNEAAEYEGLDTYGLQTPAKTISITKTDGTMIILKIGNYNEMLDGYYLIIDGIETLYVVDDSLLSTFEVSYTSLEYVEEETESTESTEIIETNESELLQ